MKTPDKSTFLNDMRGLTIARSNPYIRVYPAFLRFFESRKVITRDDFVIAANFTYGWMPTIVDLAGTDGDWGKAAELLTRAKTKRVDQVDDLTFLTGLVNNSLVGVSKILHFVNPRLHAIWDSRVYRYLTNDEPYHYRVNKLESYNDYLKICDEIAEWTETLPLVEQLSSKLGHDLTPMRAIELTMFVKGVLP